MTAHPLVTETEQLRQWRDRTTRRLIEVAARVTTAGAGDLSYIIKDLRTRVDDCRDAMDDRRCSDCGGIPRYTCGEADRIAFSCRNYRGWDRE